MFVSILVAHDGSDHAKNAPKVAAGRTKTYGAQLHLTHTSQVGSQTIMIGSSAAALDTLPTKEHIQKAGHIIVEQALAAARAEGVDTQEVHLGAVEPARFVLAAAAKCNADLIVQGRRGPGSLRALALGSVSQSVAHGAKCAFLTVL